MANIEKRANGTYRVKVCRNGSPTQTATFHTRTDAKKWSQVIEAAILEGRHFPLSKAKRHTLAVVLDRYVDTVGLRQRPSTIPSQRQHFAYWRTHLGAYTLSAITPGMVAHRDLLARNRQSSTVRRYLAALSHALTIAVKEWTAGQGNRGPQNGRTPCGISWGYGIMLAEKSLEKWCMPKDQTSYGKGRGPW
jgi:hypothetical protein